MFIATANDLRGIPAPLRDRMEIIPIPGYTIEDKIPIATKHLFPKQLKLHGLNDKTLQVTEEGFKFLGNFDQLDFSSLRRNVKLTRYIVGFTFY
jgi:ATP-dependent Lon protease